jgi:hypothetical protein
VKVLWLERLAPYNAPSPRHATVWLHTRPQRTARHRPLAHAPGRSACLQHNTRSIAQRTRQ